MNIYDQELEDILQSERDKRGRRKKRVCQARGCIRMGHSWAGEWFMCQKHAPMWREHNRIVNRILEIPCRTT